MVGWLVVVWLIVRLSARLFVVGVVSANVVAVVVWRAVVCCW